MLASASNAESSDLYFLEKILSADAKGFITPTFTPRLLVSDAKAAAMVVLPTPVSVPVMNRPFMETLLP